MNEILRTATSNTGNQNNEFIPKKYMVPQVIPEDNMGISIMLNDSTNSLSSRKRPLHSFGTPCSSPGSNKRGKVFSSLSLSSAETVDLCKECPTADTNTDENSCKPVQEDQPVPTPAPADGDDDGRVAETVVTPTIEDYASLFFGAELSFEEQETRAKMVDLNDVSTPRSSNRASMKTTTSTSTSKSTSKRSRRKRRRVTFGVCIPIFHLLHDVPPAHAMTSEEKTTLWYSRPDLDNFKIYAQSSIQDMRNRIMVMGNAHEYKDRSKFREVMLTAERETNSSIRGLEHRVFRRKQTRQVLIRDVLQCQAHVQGLAQFGHQMDSMEKERLLANVSMERSVKARGVAFVDAKDDYAEVYCGSVDAATDDFDAHDINMFKPKQARQVSIEPVSTNHPLLLG